MINDYQYRFIMEYMQLCDRLSKLHDIVIKYKAGTLDFEPNCPLSLLMDQEEAMDEYKRILEIRAEIENINLHS